MLLTPEMTMEVFRPLLDVTHAAGKLDSRPARKRQDVNVCSRWSSNLQKFAAACSHGHTASLTTTRWICQPACCSSATATDHSCKHGLTCSKGCQLLCPRCCHWQSSGPRCLPNAKRSTCQHIFTPPTPQICWAYFLGCCFGHAC
jgi:hypothetical protein